MLISLIALSFIPIQPIKAQNQVITINADGSVSPSSAPIHQIGQTYTLNANLSNPLIIQANNIVVNGGNNTVQGLSQQVSETAISLTANNVTITNFIITNWKIGVNSVGNSNTITNNELINNNQGFVIEGYNFIIKSNAISKASIALILNAGNQTNNNLIVNNQILDSALALDATNSIGTTFVSNYVQNCKTILHLSSEITNIILYNNDFINSFPIEVPNPLPQIVIAPFTPHFTIISPAGLWDNGTVGNYWSDYLTTYPNATELDHTGTGNTPYLINFTAHYGYSVHGRTPGSQDWSINGVALLASAMDNHPLMTEASIPIISLKAPSTTTQILFSDETFTITVFIALVLTVGVSLLLYRWHRRNSEVKKL